MFPLRMGITTLHRERHVPQNPFANCNVQRTREGVLLSCACPAGLCPIFQGQKPHLFIFLLCVPSCPAPGRMGTQTFIMHLLCTRHPAGVSHGWVEGTLGLRSTLCTEGEIKAHSGDSTLPGSDGAGTQALRNEGGRE